MTASADLQIMLRVVDQASAALRNVGGEVRAVGGHAQAAAPGFLSMSTQMMAVQAAAGAVVGGLQAVGGAIGSAVSAAASFESKMSSVKAISDATGEEMQQLSALALQLGADTSFSAGEAAEGIEELLKGGLRIEDVLGGGAAAALNLAAAGSVSLKDAAEIASNAVGQFSLKGEDLAHVADLIAGAANASSLDVTDFKFSLAAAGAVANTVGFSFDDLAQGIAVMGAAGIRGSDAGTSLKTMMLNLQPATEKQTTLFRRLGIVTEDGANRFFDASGKVRSMAEVADVLQDALADMTEQQRIAALEVMFGSDAIRAGAVLTKQGAEGFNAMAAAMGKVTAESVGKTKLDNLKGSIDALKGSAETLGIVAFTPLLPLIRSLVDSAASFTNALIPLAEVWGPRITATLGTMIGAIEGLFGILLGNNNFDEVRDALDNFFPPAISDAIIDIVNHLGGVFDAIFVGDIPNALRSAMLVLDGWLDFIFASVETWAEAIAGWVDGAGDDLTDNLGDLLTDVLSWIQRNTSRIVQRLARWASAFVDWVAPKIPPLLTALGLLLTRIGTWIVNDGLPTLVTNLLQWGSAFVDWVAPRILPLLAALGGLLTSLGGWIVGTALPAIVSKLVEWGSAFVAWVAPRIPPLLAELGSLLTQLGTWITSTALPAIASKVAEWGMAFVSWVAGAVSNLMVELGKLRFEVSLWIGARVADFGSQVAAWVGAFVGWVGTAITTLLGATALGKLATDVKTWIGQQGPGLTTKLGEWATAFTGWVAGAITALLGTTALGRLILDVKAWITDQVTGLTNRLAAWGGAFTAWVAGTITTLLGAGNLGKLIGDVTTWISSQVAGLTSTLAGWASAFVGWVAGAITSLLGSTALGRLILDMTNWMRNTALPEIVSRLADWAAAMFGWVSPERIQGLITALGGFGTSIFSWMRDTALPEIVSRIADWIAAVFGWVTSDRIQGLITALGGLGSSVFNWLRNTALPEIVSRIADWIAAVFGWVNTDRIQGLISALGGLGSSIYSWIRNTALPEIVSRIADWIVAIFGWVTSPRIEGLLGALAGMGTAIYDWMRDTALPEIVSRVADWIATVFGWVTPERIQTLITNLGSMGTSIFDWMRDTALPEINSRIADWVAAFLGWPATVVADLGVKLDAIVTSLRDWVTNNAANVSAEAGRLGGQIVGGIEGGINSALPGFNQFLTEFANGIPAFIRNILNLDQDTGAMAMVGDRMVEEIMIGISNRWPELDDMIGNLSNSLGRDLGGNSNDWLDAAMEYADVGDDWQNGLRRLVSLESGGDPFAVNPTSGASGLLQMMPGTFDAYRHGGLPDDIFNAIANAVASIRYIQDTYSHVDEIPGLWGDNFQGYAMGGFPRLGVPALVGEQGPELFVPTVPGYIVPNHHLSAVGAGAAAFPTRASGGGVTVVVNVHGNTILGEDRAVAQKLARIIGPELNRRVGIAG